MSSLEVSPDLLQYIDFTTGYLESEFALLVPDYAKDRFKKKRNVEQLSNFTVAAVDTSPFLDAIWKSMPYAKVVIIDRHLDFFTGKVKADALLIGAKEGAAWTLRYPHYGVAVPMPLIYQTYYAYGVAQNQREFLHFVNQWLELQKVNGFIDLKYDYWILGKESPKRIKNRWSILQNVLHWTGKSKKHPEKTDYKKDLEKSKKKSKILKKINPLSKPSSGQR